MIQWFKDPVPEYRNCALTMGNFDGMHLGHQSVLKRLVTEAGTRGLTPVVISYFEHPGHFIHFKHPVCILTPRVLKREMFAEAGVKDVCFLNFTAETAHVSAAVFLQEVIIPYFHPGLILSGYDSHFGYQREGNAELLKSHEQEYGYETLQIDPVYMDDVIVSSSYIREKLAKGELKTANDLLGKPYCLYGTVTYGKRIGRTIGFPTINLSLLDSEQLIPANGIYLSRLAISGRQYFGLTNIGVSPTLKNMNQIEIETHILDFSGEIYNETIGIELIHYIRKEQKFNSVQELRNAIQKDINKGRELVKQL
jgi:riboflavin kinase/FMN adenylyltransferase